MSIEPSQIIRSRRKSVALIVRTSGELIVRAPFLTPLAEIRALIVRKEPWIRKKQADAEAASNHFRALCGVDGEAFSFLGAEVTVHRTAVSVPKLENGILYLPLSPEGQEGLRRFLKRAALNVMRERTQYWVAQMGLPCSGVHITSARTRWGSCSPKNGLNFSFRLVLCPPAAVDYVVVHELCHILHKNHGRAFYDAVATVLPDWPARQLLLRENHHLMNVI